MGNASFKNLKAVRLLAVTFGWPLHLGATAPAKREMNRPRYRHLSTAYRCKAPLLFLKIAIYSSRASEDAAPYDGKSLAGGTIRCRPT